MGPGNTISHFFRKTGYRETGPGPYNGNAGVCRTPAHHSPPAPAPVSDERGTNLKPRGICALIALQATAFVAAYLAGAAFADTQPAFTPTSVDPADAVCLDYNAIRISWTNPQDPAAISVDVLRRPAEGGDFVTLASGLHSSPYVDTTAREGQAYNYRLVARSAGGTAYTDLLTQTFLRLQNRARPALDTAGNLYCVEKQTFCRILKSTDGGITTQPRGTLSNNGGYMKVGALYVDPFGYIYAGTGDGTNLGNNKVYRSTTPDGSAFAPVKDATGTNDLVVHHAPGECNLWYQSWGFDCDPESRTWVFGDMTQGTSDQLYTYRSTDGVRFTESPQLALRYPDGRHIHSVKWDPYRHLWFVTCGDWKVMSMNRSVDAVNFAQIAPNMKTGFTSITFTPQAMIMGTDAPQGNIIYRSTDGGNTLTPVLALQGRDDCNTWGAVAYPDGEVWMSLNVTGVGTGNSVWMSPDHGLHWRKMAEGPIATSSGQHPTPDFMWPAMSSSAQAVGDYVYFECYTAGYVARFRRLKVIDTTPPTTPVVIDDGPATPDHHSLHARWSATDPDTLITEYQYAIGTTPEDPGSGYVVPWKSAGISTEATEAGLNLQTGEVCYWYVRAKNFSGLWSDTGVSAGTRVGGTGAICVSLSGDDANSGLTWAEAKRTIQAGIETAMPAEEVRVAAGQYSENVVLKQGIRVYGGYPVQPGADSLRDWRANTAQIDGGMTGSTVTAPQGSGGARLDGFTLSSGYAQDGGGILCQDSCLFAHNTLMVNFATGNGGAVRFENCGAQFVSNLVLNNTAGGYGGAIDCVNASPVIANNTFVSNYSSQQGGAISCRQGSAPIVASNVITQNTGEGSVYADASSNPALRCNCLWANGAADYLGAAPGAGDLLADPLLDQSGQHPYHLTRQSPCINAGWAGIDVAAPFDIDGEVRIAGGRVDIGADEVPPPTTPVVTDEGDWTFSAGTLSATWQAQDPDFGVQHYRWAIGESPDGPPEEFLQGWTDAGDATGVTAAGLPLMRGHKYYWFVQAESGAGVWSDAGVSDGILVIPEYTIGQAKQMDDNTPVVIEDVAVTRSGQGEFWTEEPGRSAGVRVVSPANPAEGCRVDVQGEMADDGPERVVMAETVVCHAGTPITPMVLRTEDLGPGSGAGRGRSLPADGLLVTVMGRVTALGAGCYYLSDGGNVPNDTPNAASPAKVNGLKVATTDTPPNMGDYVRVTGIVRLEAVDGGVICRLDISPENRLTIISP